jgi:hypothetical protein
VTLPRARAAVLATALVVGAAACSEAESADPSPTSEPTEATTSTEAALEVPPAAASDLDVIYGAALADIGLALTDRGGLIDRSGGGYVPSAAGDHLALYVTPTGQRSMQQYVDGIRDVAVIFDDVFERWPGLASFDVCQEPLEDAPPGREPLPVTQIEVTRQEAAAIDWDAVTAADLVRSSRADPPGLALRVSAELLRSSAYEAIVADVS